MIGRKLNFRKGIDEDYGIGRLLELNVNEILHENQNADFRLHKGNIRLFWQ